MSHLCPPSVLPLRQSFHVSLWLLVFLYLENCTLFSMLPCLTLPVLLSSTYGDSTPVGSLLPQSSPLLVTLFLIFLMQDCHGLHLGPVFSPPVLITSSLCHCQCADHSHFCDQHKTCMLNTCLSPLGRLLCTFNVYTCIYTELFIYRVSSSCFKSKLSSSWWLSP